MQSATETSESQTSTTESPLNEVPTGETPATETPTASTSATQYTVLGAPPIEGRPTGSQRMNLHPERTPAPEILFEIVAATRDSAQFAPIVPTPRSVPPPIQEVLNLSLNLQLEMNTKLTSKIRLGQHTDPGSES